MRTLGWAFFLASSWTWCIGMLLPALLARDYGPLGFAAFAIPNVLGAAAMGWVMRSGQPQQRFVLVHRRALDLFSAVTVAFHVYWLGWLSGPVLPTGSALPWAALVMMLVIAGRAAPGAWPLIGALAWLASAAVFGVVLTSESEPAFRASRPPGDVLYLAPAMAFGFLLCPYLDHTFHLARHRCPGGRGPVAFGLGFGVFFAAMIALTFAYGPTLLSPAVAEEGFTDRPLVFKLVAAHLAWQSAFTVAAHLSRLRFMTAAGRFRPSGIAFFCSLTAVGLIGVVSKATSLPSLAGLAPGEVGYRVFLVFYGLVFPAYVFAIAAPRRRPTPAAVAVLALACLVALPFYAASFLWRIELAALPGVGAAVAARFAISRLPAAPYRPAGPPRSA